MAEPVITKRRVTMRSARLGPDGELIEFEANDYVRPDHLEAYVADARTRWEFVEVSEEPDAGPLGYDGPTAVPAHLPLPDAGEIYPATPGSAVERDLEVSRRKAMLERTQAEMLTRPVLVLPTDCPLPTEDLEGFLAYHRAHFGDASMLIATVGQRNTLAAAYAAAATHAALFSTAPSGANPGTELAGGSPAYGRKATAWSAPANGVITTTPPAFDVPSGSAVAGGGLYNALSAGTYLDGVSLTSQTFASQGTYTLTLTYTQN